MRIGVLTHWLSGRYLPFWEAYLREMGVEMVRPETPAIKLPLPEPLQKVMGEVISLKGQGVDYLLLPDVQLGVESKKGNPSPWMIDLEASLRRLIPGMPPALVVPAELSNDLTGTAAEIGQGLTRNPMTTRRALERTKYLLVPEFNAPKQAGSGLVGLVAQPVLLDDPATLQQLRDSLENEGLKLFLSDKSPPELREEGQKLELGLEFPTDLEAAGMHRYFSRIGRVKAIVYLHDEEYFPLPNPLRKLVNKSEASKPWRLVGLDADWPKLAGELAKELGV